MKKLLTSILIFLAIFHLKAEIAVKSFRKLESDMTARIDAPKKDQNGDVCAIIKVITTQDGFTWEPDALGIKEVVRNGAEYWLYVPFGAKRLTINHSKLGILRDYMYPLPIEKACVYEMVLITGRIETSVIEEIAKQWLVITPLPEKAMIYIDDVFVAKGEYQAQLSPGTYNYRVEAPLYHTEAGKLEISDAKKELKVNLKPAFGYLNINTTPEAGATIIIDGNELTKTTPSTSEKLPSGEHSVQVIKEMYQPATQKVMVMDNQTTPVSFTLVPNFAELSITAPQQASIVINGQLKGKGSWNGRLSAGIYSVEAQLDKHRSAKQDVQLAIGDKKEMSLQPTPIYGSVNIVTTPSGATIIIEGKEYGTTPNTINKVLIGEYNVQLSRIGFESVFKNITVFENKNTEIVETMSKIKEKNNSNNNNSSSILRNDIDSMSYCLGLNVGTDFAKNLKGIPGGEANKDILILGFSTAMKEEKVLINSETSQEYFKKYIEKAQKDNKGIINKTKNRNSTSILTNEIDSMSYCLGLNVGNDFAKNIKEIPGGKANLDILINGFSTAMKDNKALIDTAYSSSYFKKYIENAQIKDVAIRKAEGEKFLLENKLKKGVITTQTGLQYQVLTSKNGIKPNVNDTVKVHYVGSLVNGNVFDSSIERGEPIEFPINQVIPGWTEGLKLMSVGSKYKFVVPYSLGYGEQGTKGGPIPGYSVLIFEVELLAVKPQKK